MQLNGLTGKPKKQYTITHYKITIKVNKQKQGVLPLFLYLSSEMVTMRPFRTRRRQDSRCTVPRPTSDWDIEHFPETRL